MFTAAAKKIIIKAINVCNEYTWVGREKRRKRELSNEFPRNSFTDAIVPVPLISPLLPSPPPPLPLWFSEEKVQLV